MDTPELSTRVVIEKRTLRGSGNDEILQRVAIVYIDGDEYRIWAPSQAVGDALQWLAHFRVRRPESEALGSEADVENVYSILAIKLVKEELERLQRSADGTLEVGTDNVYYHVRMYTTSEPGIEVKFDLRRVDLEKRVLEPYRSARTIVLGGRTIRTEDLKRIEIFETSYPSSQFTEMASVLARQGAREWFFAERDVMNVTDELITTPVVTFMPQRDNVIELLCLRFHIVAKQLRDRHDGRPTVDVTDEYDVQDLLHALLRIFFEDVRTEEWTPSYAGSSARMDFLLPVEELVIEVKKSRPGLGAKELGRQLIEDIARYKAHPSCKRLICFVYDPEDRIVNPRGIESDLSRNEGDFGVEVIITPRG
jgi:REase_DpnII-MboI